jgi:hypothetical protein
MFVQNIRLETGMDSNEGLARLFTKCGILLERNLVAREKKLDA